MASFAGNAQTSKEWIGKWQLVKWVQHGKDKDIVSKFKPDKVFEVFLENGKFQSLVGYEVHKSKWKLTEDNKQMTIASMLIITVKFHIDYFDAKKRTLTSDVIGTLEYQKAD